MVWIAPAFPLLGYMIISVAGSCFDIPAGMNPPDILAERESYCFAFYDSLKTWSESRDTCRKLNAELIRMTGPDLQEFVVGNMAEIYGGRREIVSIWLGARYESKANDWRWENGDAVEWTDWVATSAAGPCVIYRGGWRKSDCGGYEGTVCQKETTITTTTETSGTSESVPQVTNVVQRRVRKNTSTQKYQRFRYFSVVKAKHLLRVPWMSTKAWSITNCSSHCWEEDTCVLANFDVRWRTCNLYNTMSALEQGLEKDEDWYLMVVTEK